MTSFFDAPEQYLVVTACCVGNKIKPQLEPFFNQVCAKFPHANVYQKRGDGSKDRPGTIKTIGNIIVCFSQYYAGKNNLPSDSREQRLLWFKKCLKEIILIDRLQSIAFPSDITIDSGGNKESYVQAIKDFEQYIKLEKPQVKIVTYFDTEQPEQQKAQTPAVNRIILGEVQKRIYRVEQLYRLQIDSNEQVRSEPKEPNELVKPVGSDSGANLSTGSKEPIRLVTSRPKVSNFAENPNWRSLHTLVRETVHASWLQKVFSDSVIKSELDRLDEFFKKELADFGDDVAILPQPFENIFRAFKEPLEQVNVVILGQDPYHANREEATGLAFAVNEGVPIPPSLRNIFKELSTDSARNYPAQAPDPARINSESRIPDSARNFPKSTISDLDNWAQQGVLLLNTALTVRQKKPGSHLKEWQPFTDRIIEMLGSDPTHPRVFLLWGNAAQAKASLIQSHNEILTAAHPSPLSASRGWFGCAHFSKTNELLIKLKYPTVNF